jgi:hypothetical protein
MKRYLLLITITVIFYGCGSSYFSSTEYAKHNSLLDIRQRLKVDTSSLKIAFTGYLNSVKGDPTSQEIKEAIRVLDSLVYLIDSTIFPNPVTKKDSTTPNANNSPTEESGKIFRTYLSKLHLDFNDLKSLHKQTDRLIRRLKRRIQKQNPEYKILLNQAESDKETILQMEKKLHINKQSPCGCY